LTFIRKLLTSKYNISFRFCFINKCIAFVKEVTTVEGVINRSIVALEQDQIIRKVQHPETAAQIDIFIQKLQELKDVKTPFTVVSAVEPVVIIINWLLRF
jgi:hypothetical protein